MGRGRKFVLLSLGVIALFDVACGLRTLLGPEPWLYNGMSDTWLALPAGLRADPTLVAYATGPARFLGAFRLYAGLVTAAWGFSVRHDGKGLSLLLGTYTLAGLGLGYCDNTFATEPTWHASKQALGALWVAMLVVHVMGERRSRQA